MELSKIIIQIRNNNNWKNESRIIGEACEEYIKNSIKCVRCKNGNFEKYKTNEKSKDLFCLECNQKYQIKAKCATQKQLNNIIYKNEFKTIGGEYSTTINNINENIDYIIILYEKNSYEIKKLLYIKNEFINTECIIPRKPLSLTAKRAGWQGCNIIFNNFEIIK
jgi:type II restriction enzyme